jgi:MFS family permease
MFFKRACAMPLEEPESHILELPSPHLEHKRRRGILFLCLATAAVSMALNLQLSLNDNFCVNEIGINASQKGYLEALRETCGITALAVLALLAGLAEPLIGAAMLLLVGVGLGCYAGANTVFAVAALSVVWSQGLHVWMPLPNSMMMSLAEKGKTGWRLGQMQAAGAAGSVAILLAMLAMVFFGQVPIRPLYILGGGLAILGAVACLGIPRDIKTPGPRFIFRRKYALYYLLSFLEGWRKQIFLAFAGFLLVKNYDLPLKYMLVLWTLSQATVWLLSSTAGRLIDRVGERKVLTVYYTLLIGVFAGYAFIHDPLVLAGLFICDGILFTLGMALTTYVRRIAPPEEHTPTLSMGVAMNHVAAVSMPLVGGLLWTYVRYEWTFGIGMLAAALSVLVVARLPRHAAS